MIDGRGKSRKDLEGREPEGSNVVGMSGWTGDGPVEGSARPASGEVQGPKVDQGEGEAESGWREISQVRFQDSFAFTKYEGILQKVTGNGGDRIWWCVAVQGTQLQATL